MGRRWFLSCDSTGAPTIPGEVTIPDWVVQDILPINEYSRPGIELSEVNGVVVHYTGNPGTIAEQNRSYYKNLAETKETYASSHFVIGMDGKIIQCVPLWEGLLNSLTYANAF
ncbi:N-acetylmuramoyl-L-alanine amidase [Colidextribacter sp. OB.20]|uniref:N-acetylmuramoyl-L-alanine amidase n=1 Tax=Colidextribacter sp. OB.20 TaxID=2304568 RepID=UPI00136E5276|nr:N-acetylmuramoyl-L-alanine amidase [Colidextribacter sp. OB.20]